jgi:hypothetical protein
MNAAMFDYTPFANVSKGLRGWWLNLAGGSWFLAIAGPVSARTLK